jgi:hypothetical protein
VGEAVKRNGGGLAFPQLIIESGERDGHGDQIDPITASEGGMTVRQYFAAHAPITFSDAVAYHDGAASYEQTLKTLAQMRLAYADATIAAESTT